jgi:hypothetical protein
MSHKETRQKQGGAIAQAMPRGELGTKDW